MTKQYNDKTYTQEANPFAYYKRHWKSYYQGKTYKDAPISSFLHKLKGKELAMELGVRVPKLYYSGQYEECPKAVLERKDTIIKRLSGAGGSYKKGEQRDWRGERVIIEQAIQHFWKPEKFKIPFDYKVYLFGGKVAYVLVYNRNYQEDPRKPAFMLLDRERRIHTERLGLPTHRWMKERRKVIPSEMRWEQLIGAAERIAKRVFPKVFVRLDFYMDRAGAVFGELSPNPCGRFVVGFHERDPLLNELIRPFIN
jgi:hypothetical protein